MVELTYEPVEDEYIPMLLPEEDEAPEPLINYDAVMTLTNYCDECGDHYFGAAHGCRGEL